MPVGGRRDFVAYGDEGRTLRSGAVESCRGSAGVFRISELQVAREVKRPVGECWIEREDLAFKRRGRLLKRRAFAEREIAGGPAGGDFARIDFVTQVPIDDPASPGRRAEGDAVRGAAGDSGNDPISVAEVEARVETKGHDGRGCMGGALSGEHGHFAAVVHAHGVVAGGQGIDAVEVIALDPILQFAGLIAGVLSDFEHRHYDDFDRNPSWGSQQGGIGNAQKEQGEEDPFEGHRSIIFTGPCSFSGKLVSLLTPSQYTIEIIP